MKIISPTGKGIRIRDDWGSGLFGAPRGNDVHLGVDWICKPGEPFVAPVTPTVFRPSRPYTDFPEYGGIAFETEIFIIDLWYVVLHRWVSDPQAVIKQGWEIGICQDIREKKSRSRGTPYGDGMIPHLHMQVRIRPELLLPRADEYIDPLSLM